MVAVISSWTCYSSRAVIPWQFAVRCTLFHSVLVFPCIFPCAPCYSVVDQLHPVTLTPWSPWGPSGPVAPIGPCNPCIPLYILVPQSLRWTANRTLLTLHPLEVLSLQVSHLWSLSILVGLAVLLVAVVSLLAQLILFIPCSSILEVLFGAISPIDLVILLVLEVLLGLVDRWTIFVIPIPVTQLEQGGK